MTLLRIFATIAALAACTAFAQAPAPDDAQIAAIVVAANQVDIDAGKQAESKASGADVKAFAKRMVTDHSGVNRQAVALVTRLHVKPQENETSRSLVTAGAAARKRLAGLQGADYDRAYVDNEVSYHEAVLSAVDHALIPNAKNAELKALLVNVRPAFVAHLEHAKHIQAALRK